MILFEIYTNDDFLTSFLTLSEAQRWCDQSDLPTTIVEQRFSKVEWTDAMTKEHEDKTYDL